MFIERAMEKQIVIHSHTKILCSGEKEEPHHMTLCGIVLVT
jgi:hypothetical protein